MTHFFFGVVHAFIGVNSVVDFSALAFASQSYQNEDSHSSSDSNGLGTLSGAHFCGYYLMHYYWHDLDSLFNHYMPDRSHASQWGLLLVFEVYDFDLLSSFADKLFLQNHLYYLVVSYLVFYISKKLDHLQWM